jgi:hypothetical protein
VVAQQRRWRLFGFARGGRDDAVSREFECRRLEDKRVHFAEATQHWLEMLREMERTGESSDPRYDAYFRNYIEARQQEKRIDLDLFNLRRGLVK